MKTAIRDFCRKYDEKLINDKDIAERDIPTFNDLRDRITFRVNVLSICPAIMKSFIEYSGNNLFDLDEEDLKYLYNKYSKKIEEEMRGNISEIEKMYKDDTIPTSK